MSFDFNYLKYQLKAFFVSTHKLEEMEFILNDLDPKKCAKEYVKSLRFNEAHEKIVLHRLLILIEEAYIARVPLGTDTKTVPSDEDAYVYRQRYLSKYENLGSTISTFNKLCLLIMLAACIIVVIMLFT
jgi:hypothetical protein